MQLHTVFAWRERCSNIQPVSRQIASPTCSLSMSAQIFCTGVGGIEPPLYRTQRDNNLAGGSSYLKIPGATVPTPCPLLSPALQHFHLRSCPLIECYLLTTVRASPLQQKLPPQLMHNRRNPSPRYPRWACDRAPPLPDPVRSTSAQADLKRRQRSIVLNARLCTDARQAQLSPSKASLSPPRI